MASFIKGNHYHWSHDPATRLVYLGHNWSGNGYWHQFARISSPTEVWCEVTDKELPMIHASEAPTEEETKIDGLLAIVRRWQDDGEGDADTVKEAQKELRKLTKCSGAFDVIKDRNHTGEEVIDTVFGKGFECREMRDSLVDHDGYDSDIIVRRACACPEGVHEDHQFPESSDAD